MKHIIYTITFILFVQFSYAQIEAIDKHLVQPDQVANSVIVTETIIKEKVEIPKVVQTDFDKDGIPDSVEGTGDIDKDGIPNYKDLDSDGDRVQDILDQCYYFRAPTTLYGGCGGGTGGGGTTTVHHGRKVFWVHGYQGNETSFTIVGDEVEDRFKVDSKRPGYTASQGSLAEAATNLTEDIETATHDQAEDELEQNFIIAHSLGGLVTRTMGLQYNDNNYRLFNGFITLSTPHQGAAAADTYINNPQLIDNIITDACQKLTVGPALDLIDDFGYISDLLILFGIPTGAVNSICEAGVNIALPIVFDFAEQGLEAEITTTAASNIQDMETDHNAVFYAVEDGRDDGSLTPRFMGSLTNPPSGFPLYGADSSDDLGIAEVATQLDFYVTNANSNTGATASAYQEGADWFNSLNDIWLELIGARVSEVQTNCDCHTHLTEDWNECMYGDPTGLLCYTSVIIKKDSDGFILAESSMNAPGATPAYAVTLMDGSGHMQLKNDSNMAIAVDAIFLDGLGFNYFATEER